MQTNKVGNLGDILLKTFCNNKQTPAFVSNNLQMQTIKVHIDMLLDILKFICSKKSTKFCEISTVDLTITT